MDDVRAVMDAAGSSRAALFGASEGAPMSLLFAATYPERTAALVLWGGYAREMWAPDYPWGTTEEAYRESMDAEQRMFGPREDAEAMLRQSSLGIEDVGHLSRLLPKQHEPRCARGARFDEQADRRAPRAFGDPRAHLDRSRDGRHGMFPSKEPATWPSG